MTPRVDQLQPRSSRRPQRRRLTVKLNGRAEAPDWRRGRTISSSARGAQPPAHHGPFQRWLEDALNKSTVRARHLQRKPKLTDGTNPHRPAEAQPRQSAATSAGLACWPHGLPARAQTEALSEGSWLLRVESGSRPSGGFLLRPLTVKLRGRVTTPDERRGRTLSSRARGAKQTTPHGPLQRLLEVTLTDHHCARAAPRRQPKPTYPRAERAQGRTRTSDAPNEDACRTTRSASAGISAAPSEGVSCSSRRLSPLSGF